MSVLELKCCRFLLIYLNNFKECVFTLDTFNFSFPKLSISPILGTVTCFLFRVIARLVLVLSLIYTFKYYSDSIGALYFMLFFCCHINIILYDPTDVTTLTQFFLLNLKDFFLQTFAYICPFCGLTNFDRLIRRPRKLFDLIYSFQLFSEVFK